MEKLVINADDFGLNSSVNRAIVDLLNNGLINSATLMANMPAFDEAVRLVHKYGLAPKIGLHLVLTEGTPLTEEIKEISFLFSGKKNYKKNKYQLLFPNKKLKDLIYNEFIAQIEKVRSSNILITHFDTHHHVHEMYGVCKILLVLKKKYDIPSIRILNNLEKSPQIHKNIYRRLINFYLKNNNSNFSDFFGNQCDFISTIEKNPRFLKNKIEIMVHPDYDPHGKLIDKIGKDLDFSFLDYIYNELQESSLSL